MKMKNKKLLLEVPVDNIAVVSIVRAFGDRKDDIDITCLPWVYLNIGANDHTVRNTLADLDLLESIQDNI